MTLEWDEFFPDFFETLVKDKPLFVNWNTKGRFWEVTYVRNILFVTGNKERAFEYAEYYAKNRV